MGTVFPLFTYLPLHTPATPVSTLTHFQIHDLFSTTVTHTDTHAPADFSVFNCITFVAVDTREGRCAHIPGKTSDSPGA